MVYAWMRYVLETADPWAIVNHPLQPQVQHLHVITAPLLVFAFGMSWRHHIAPRLRRFELGGHRSGVSLCLTLLPMVLSGSLIQTAVEASWRRIWVWVHLASSALWLVGYLAHQWSARERQKLVEKTLSTSKAT